MNFIIKQSADNILDSIYINRDINDDIIDSMLYSDTWENPNKYTNINQGYDLLMDTIEKGGDIWVLVDPDLDGYCSAATIFNFIYDDLKYDNVWYMIKKKSKKSHGLDREVIENVEQNDMDLLIIPDGGTNDYGYQKEISKLGVDILILDHHIIEEKKDTNAIIINNQDGVVENRDLSGAGVTYKFVYYVAEQEGLDLGYKYLDLVALSLISDVCDMRSLENRFIFNLGCQKSNVTNKLMKSFVKDLKIKDKFSIEDMGYGVAPILNSIIRLSDGEEKEELMESLLNSSEEVKYRYRSKDITQSIQDAILRYGRKFKSRQKKMVEKAVENIEVFNDKDDRILIVNSGDMPSEVRGLIANKLMSEYSKPVLLLSGKDTLRGSARGLNSIDFKDLCDKSMLFTETIGHSNAFGCSINKDNVGKLVKFMNKELLGVDLSNVTEIDYVYEGGIPLNDVLDLKDIEDLWCSTIKRPRVLVKNMIIDSSKMYKRGIDLSYKDENNVVYKRDYCSKKFFNDLICEEDNENQDKMLNVNMICEVKVNNGYAYVNILDFESSVIEEVA